jgi:hypothetical protein
MSDTTPLPAMPPLPPTAPPQRRPGPLAAGLAGLALGAAIVGGVWAATASGPSGPGTFTLTGSFVLAEDAARTDGGCGGRYDSGYDDIHEGASVTVYGASGAVIATGELGDSSYVDYKCTFKVAVPDVPKGEKFYKVEVAQRGTVQLSAKEAEGGDFGASLG